MDEKKIYDFVRKNYDKGAKIFSSTRKYNWKDLAFIKDYVKDGYKVLDFGCGNGRLVDLLKDKKVDYTGVDVSKRLIEIAKQKYKKYRFVQISPFFEEYKNFKSNSFDMIFSIGVFHHFPKGGKRDEIVKRLKAILKRKGLLFISVWNLRIPKFNKHLKEKKEGISTFKNGKGELMFERYLYGWTKKELEQFLLEKGFKIIDSGFTKRDGDKVNIYCILEK